MDCACTSQVRSHRRSVFDDMQKKMIQHCDQYMVATLDIVEENRVSADTAAMGQLVSKTTAPLGRVSGKRSHKKRALVALPTHGVVDMSTGGTEWHPRCLLAPGTKNVAMEATTENFTKLFEVVSLQLVETATQQLAALQTHTRMIRRRPSDEKAPRGSPANRKYYIASKGWVRKVTPDKPTPCSGSGSSCVCTKHRRFLKDIPRTGPKISRRASAATKKRRNSRHVLSHDGLSEPDANDESSSDHNPYGMD